MIAPDQVPTRVTTVDTIGLGNGQDGLLLGALARESGGLYQAL